MAKRGGQTPIGIALGSNQGKRLDHLQAAVDWLKKISTTPMQCSHVYETAPIGCPEGTSFFLNAVCEITSNMDPLELLRRMRHFERRRGRASVYPRNAPRPLDMDLLYAGDIVVCTKELILPHPRMFKRRFVLQPLCDICPDLVLPGQTHAISEMLHSLRDDTEVRICHEF